MINRQNMKTNQYLFFKYTIVALLFLFVFACSTDKEIKKNVNDTKSVNLKRINADIEQLDREQFEQFLTGFHLMKEEKEKIDVIPYYFDNRCLVFIPNWETAFFSPLPLQEDHYSSLILLYSRIGNKWKLDTALTSYPDLLPIEKSTRYFLAGSQRCIEGRCEWYNAIQKITKDNQLKTVFEYENFNRTMYLEDLLLSENREFVFRRIGEEVQGETEILEYVWSGQELQEIRIKETIGILQAVENDSLIIKSDSLFRTIDIKAQ